MVLFPLVRRIFNRGRERIAESDKPSCQVSILNDHLPGLFHDE